VFLPAIDVDGLNGLIADNRAKIDGLIMQQCQALVAVAD
jgi:hypothetical protein